MNKKTEQNIKKVLSDKDSLTTREILNFLHKQSPDVPEATLRWELYKLKDKGIIKNPGRGVYSLNSKPDYTPDLSKELKQLHDSISEKFPLVTFCVWDSKWFNEFMIHQTFKNYHVVEVEKDAAETVFHYLSGNSRDVFLNPKQEIFDNYLINSEEPTIVISLISESPLQKAGKYNVPTLEKLLVDCLTGDELFRSQQNDLENIIQTAFEKYNINPGRIRRYASRRNIRGGVESVLKKHSVNSI